MNALVPVASVLLVVLTAASKRRDGPRGSARSERRHRRQEARIDAALAEIAWSIARALRSGVSVPVALADLSASAPSDDALDAVLGRVRATASTAALRSLLTMGQVTGGRLAAALDDLGTSHQATLDARRDARAATAQVRLSAAVMVALPIVGLVGLVSVDSGVRHVVLTTTLGRISVLAGLALDLIGGLAMALLTRRVGGR